MGIFDDDDQQAINNQANQDIGPSVEWGNAR
jgi:hypothetical protein